MKTDITASSYKGFRFPHEVIAHAVWLYHRFSLSFREVEELLFARGIVVTYETIRQWCKKFGQQYATQLRRRRSKTGDKWHLDEVFLKINGKMSYLWRAVDQNGNILDILVQSRRNKAAAKKFFTPSGYRVAQRMSICAACCGHGQAGELRGCQKGDHAKCRASPPSAAQQPLRKLAPANTSTGTHDATIQASWSCSTLPVCLHPGGARRSASISAHVAIASKRRNTAGNVREDSRSGTRQVAFRWLHSQEANEDILSLMIPRSLFLITLGRQVDNTAVRVAEQVSWQCPTPAGTAWASHQRSSCRARPRKWRAAPRPVFRATALRVPPRACPYALPRLTRPARR